MTRQQKVLALLISAKLSRTGRVIATVHDRPLWVSQGGWVKGWAFSCPEIGGDDGKRRVREVRANGIKIEKRRDNGSSVHCYRLVTDPSMINFETCKLKKRT